MAWSSYQLLIAAVMVFTGTINTLSAKWADQTKSVGRDGGPARKFDHPFVQACGMFLGELTCLIAFKLLFYTRRESPVIGGSNQQFSPFIFWPAALCDLCGTSLMYLGLNLTYASSFQMLRGAVIIFTALLSVAFLRLRLRAFHWIGICAVIVGLGLVGLSDVMFGGRSGKDLVAILIGDGLIVAAQMIVAVQMVYEQRFVVRLDIHPLQAVGWEGLFGFCTLAVLTIPMSYIYVGETLSSNPGHMLEDPIDAWVQLSNSWQLVAATLGNVASIAFFNFAGISVTKEMSATTRMVLDSMRTVFIWGISLALRWQSFQALQVPGFLLLLVGMAIYNQVLIGALCNRWLGIGFLGGGDVDEGFDESDDLTTMLDDEVRPTYGAIGRDGARRDSVLD